jgi:hypothetical protein
VNLSPALGERIWMEMQQIFGLENENLLHKMKFDGVLDALGVKLK